MRLSTLARKLNLTPGEIINALKKAGLEAPESGNAKLNDQQLEVLFKLFGTVEESQQEVIEIEAAEEIPEIDPIETVEQAVVEEQPETPNPTEEINQEPLTNIDEETLPSISTIDKVGDLEVIRVKKITLGGIKVLGKIDLPEKPVKIQADAEDGNESVKENKPRTKRVPREKKAFKGQRDKRKPLSFEEKQALEERKRLKEKREREKKIKEKKRKHFEKNVLPKQKEAAAKKKVKKVAKPQQAEGERTKLTTKNPFKRFWQWLNDPYA